MKKTRRRHKSNKFLLLGLGGSVALILLGVLTITLKNSWESLKTESRECTLISDDQLNARFVQEDNIKDGQTSCFTFNADAGQLLNINVNIKAKLLNPTKKLLKSWQGEDNIPLPNAGVYSVILTSNSEEQYYKISLKIDNSNTASPTQKTNIPKPDNYVSNVPVNAKYNVSTLPPFNPNTKLAEIVNQIVDLVQTKGLPRDRLSISLVDINSSECCAYAAFQDRQPRFPASVVKLFWMVNLYGQYQAGVIPEGKIPAKRLTKMIKDSDNNAASFILDKITATESGDDLTKEELEKWLGRRYVVNQFFEQAGYQDINISQKTFPVPELNLEKPTGREKQMRGDEQKPIRNYLTTKNVARLLYEIYTEQAISQDYSKKMKKLLKRDLQPAAWKTKEFNAIEGFFGEALPENTSFYSKMGWTFNNRNDAAIIASPDGKVRYILVVFGDDPGFYQDKQLFPEISRLVYRQMTAGQFSN